MESLVLPKGSLAMCRALFGTQDDSGAKEVELVFILI